MDKRGWQYLSTLLAYLMKHLKPLDCCFVFDSCLMIGTIFNFSICLTYPFLVCLSFPGLLMEAVYRMKYGELYLFKKALMETGQTVLANTVPVMVVPLLHKDDVNRPEDNVGMQRHQSEIPPKLVYTRNA